MAYLIYFDIKINIKYEISNNVLVVLTLVLANIKHKNNTKVELYKTTSILS